MHTAVIYRCTIMTRDMRYDGIRCSEAASSEGRTEMSLLYIEYRGDPNPSPEMIDLLSSMPTELCGLIVPDTYSFGYLIK